MPSDRVNLSSTLRGTICNSSRSASWRVCGLSVADQVSAFGTRIDAALSHIALRATGLRSSVNDRMKVDDKKA